MTKSIAYTYGVNSSFLANLGDSGYDSTSEQHLDWWRGRVDGWKKLGLFVEREDLIFELGKELYNKLYGETK